MERSSTRQRRLFESLNVAQIMLPSIVPTTVPRYFMQDGVRSFRRYGRNWKLEIATPQHFYPYNEESCNGESDAYSP